MKNQHVLNFYNSNINQTHLTMKTTPLNLLSYLIVFLIFPGVIYAQNKDKNILIENVTIFDGKNEALSKGHILIKNNLIDKISKKTISINRDSTKVIDGKEKYIIPGLIDAHAHVSSEDIPWGHKNVDAFMLGFMSAKSAKNRLSRGYTTLRDMGGNVFSLARSIDEGLIDGPRIFPSGPLISQTGGHGDSGDFTDIPRAPDDFNYKQRNDLTAIADGVPEVLKRSREQLRQGATQLKLAAGGGVGSDYDPIDVSQYTVEELEAAVSSAKNWGTYVTVHVYTPEAIKTAIEGGVQSIEHGMLIDDSTAKLLAEKGVWWSLQPFTPDDGSGVRWEGTPNMEKYLQVREGTKKAYKLAQKYDVKVAWGTDLGGPPEVAAKENDRLVSLERFGYSPFEALKMATSTNAELLEMSGPRHPYQEGKLGEVTEGAYADLILVDGNPLKDLELMADYENNFLLIIKGGKIYKNVLGD